MKLYYHPKSPNGTAVVAVARELGIPLDLQEINLPGGEQKQPGFLRINPNGKVPVLEDGDFILWESGAIMQYLAAQKPGNSLWPADDRARADISRWQLWRLGEWGRGAGILIWENVIKKFLSSGDPDPNKIREGLEFFHIGATVLNGHLENRDYLVGKNTPWQIFLSRSRWFMLRRRGYRSIPILRSASGTSVSQTLNRGKKRCLDWGNTGKLIGKTFWKSSRSKR